MAFSLAEWTKKMPDAPALIAQGQVWDFASLSDQAALAASRLETALMPKHISSMGPLPGDRAAVLMPTRPEYVFVTLALAWMGCAIVPLNTRLTGQELRAQLDIAQCEVLICSSETEARAVELADLVTTVVSVDAAAHPDVRPLAGIGFAGQKPQEWAWRAGTLDRSHWTAAIIFTSGTTGRPKGVRLSYGNFTASARASLERLGPDTSARWLLCMPLYHVGGLSIILRCGLYGSTVILHDSFDAAAVSDSIDHDGVTMVSLVPTMLHRLIEHRAGRPFPETLRCILLGGAAASPKLVAQCIEQNIPIALTYGLTEAASQVATATPEETRIRPGSAGRPLPSTSVRIQGDDGAELPAGEIGEIAVSGPTVMAGYFGQPEATAEAILDGWLHTGDLGYLDAGGFLWPVQRRSDLIISGGENIYPTEVEAALEAHPAVREVVVVGLDDPEWGQRSAALIVPEVPAPSPEVLIAHCRERLAGYKCPRLIFFVEALPRTASGKIIRAEAAHIAARMRERSAEVPE